MKEQPVKSQSKWHEFLGKEFDEEQWVHIYSSAFSLTNDSQLQSDQFNVNQRIIFYQLFVNEM